MDYNLAKKLKEAGFPQGEIVCEGDIWMCCSHGQYYTNGERNDTPYRPILSELIEACGDRFAHLKRYYPSGIWEAATDGFEQQGKTPEEAVANLWLALNK